jgi:hypothetical protein
VDISGTEDGRPFEKFGSSERRLHNETREHLTAGT